MVATHLARASLDPNKLAATELASPVGEFAGDGPWGRKGVLAKTRGWLQQHSSVATLAILAPSVLDV